MDTAVGAALAIFLTAAAFSVLTSLINRVMGITKKRIALQKRTNEYQKRTNEAIKKNDQAGLDRLKEQEKEFMKDVQESMFLPFKSMIFILPAFFVFIWAIGNAFPGFDIRLPVSLHLTGSELFALNLLSTSTYGSRGLFILSSLITGSVIEFVSGKLLKDSEKT
ncbi:MAG: EMC3/TMCO1 family protein [Candidatus Micrarchaeota archaeon]